MFDFSFFGAAVATSGEHAALIRDKAGERQRALARARTMLGRSKRRVAEGCLKSPSFFGEPERSEGDRQGFCTPKAKQNSSRLSALSRCRFILGDRCQSLVMRFGCFPTLFIALGCLTEGLCGGAQNAVSAYVFYMCLGIRVYVNRGFQKPLIQNGKSAPFSGRHV